MHLGIKLDSQSPLSLSHQLYQEIRRLIVDGTLRAGMRLPSTRELSKMLSVSRSTVSQTYEQLSNEGYVQVIAGSGTFISRELPDEQLRAAKIILPERVAAPRQYALSRYAHQVLALPEFSSEDLDLVFDFHTGILSSNDLPMAEWSRILSRVCRKAGSKELNYARHAFGLEELREALSAYLGQHRGVKCAKEQVIIVGGAQQAFDLIGRILIDEGTVIGLENPGFLAARRTFAANGAHVFPVPVDAAGLDVDYLSDNGRAIKLVHVTPGHQFPTGAVMPVSRRMRLLEWAHHNRSLIVEDDYDSEFCYVGRPSQAMQGLDDGTTVIYVGSFSKVLFPAFRLGCLVVPESLVEVFGRAKWLADRQSPAIEQMALTEFIVEGHLERHVRQMLTLYDSRRRSLLQALHLHFRDRISVFGDQAGMHVMVRLKSRLTDDEILARAKEVGVGPISTRRYYIEGGVAGEFLLAYAGLSEQVISEAVGRLARAILVG